MEHTQKSCTPTLPRIWQQLATRLHVFPVFAWISSRPTVAAHLGLGLTLHPTMQFHCTVVYWQIKHLTYLENFFKEPTSSSSGREIVRSHLHKQDRIFYDAYVLQSGFGASFLPFRVSEQVRTFSCHICFYGSTPLRFVNAPFCATTLNEAQSLLQ